MGNEELIQKAILLSDALDGENVVRSDAEILRTILAESEPVVRPEHVFSGRLGCDGVMSAVMKHRQEKLAPAMEADGVLPRYRVGEDARAFTGAFDFSHTAPDWRRILSLGFPGLLARLESAGADAGEDRKVYDLSGQIAYRAALETIARMAAAARRAGKERMAEGLEALTRRAPGTLFEAMQTMILYYDFQQNAECTVLRTLGRIDELLDPYYEADLAAGRETPESAAELIDAFLAEWNSREAIANIPFAVGGTDRAGKSLVNPFSRLFLERFCTLGLPSVKMHILYDRALPEDFVRRALESIRQGSNSIVFMNDAQTKRALRGFGADEADAELYDVVGCYEPAARGETPCSCNGRVNLAKALEITLTGGVDLLTGKRILPEEPASFPDFDSLFSAYLRRVREFCLAAAELTDAREKYDPKVHSAPFFSATFDSCVEKGGDAYCHRAAKYCNSSINLVGLATAVDSLSVIRHMVFEEKTLTLPELIGILKNDWDGNEPLRRRAMTAYPTYGTHDAGCDELAKAILSECTGTIGNRPNVKGGIYRTGAFSIDWRFSLGKRTAASANGRKAVETVSKNLCPTLGGDREGNTAIVLSVTEFDTDRISNGAVLDLVFHSSAVAGENGMAAMRTVLDVFMKRGGASIQFNVLDASVLRRAQIHPEEYPNLQVRLCGWNVLFSTLSRREQDEFIAQAEVGA